MTQTKKGIWFDQITENLVMVIDTTINVVRIVNRAPNKPNIKYDFTDGIDFDEIGRIKEGILKSLKL